MEAKHRVFPELACLIRAIPNIAKHLGMRGEDDPKNVTVLR
jgi:hypothetical protein